MNLHRPTKTIEGLLFDWNGVLLDDESIHYEALRRVVHETTGNELTRQAYQQHCQGRRDSDGLLALVQTYGWSLPIEACVRAKRTYYYEHLQTCDVSLLPGAKELLRWLRQRVAIAIVTSSSREEVEMLLHRSGQTHACHLLVAAEDVTCGKPDPEGYLLAARVLGVHPERCLVVEDSPQNLHGLVESGFELVGLGTRAMEYPAKAHVTDTLEGVLRLLMQRPSPYLLPDSYSNPVAVPTGSAATSSRDLPSETVANQSEFNSLHDTR